MYKRQDLSDLGLPLICAGGVGSERELKDAMNLGYAGVQMGTRFIATDECTTPQDYKDAIVKSGEDDITTTTKLTGVPIAIIGDKRTKQRGNWLVRRLLKSRFKHRVRVLITAISFWRMRALARGKKKSSKDLWSAGKSVETIRGVESATTIMRRLGDSLVN